MSSKHQTHRVRIGIKKATNLRAADFGFSGGKSDPYCTCELLGRPEGQIKTPVLRRTLEPEWNYEGEIEGCKPDDQLEFNVWDYDMVGNDDLLGKVVLDFDRFQHGFHGPLTMSNTGKKESTLLVKIDVLHAEPVKEDCPRCFVKVLKASHLRAADWGGKSDPYVLIQVPGQGARSKCRTRVRKNTTEPEWNEENEIPNYQLGDSLEFFVFDWDRISADDELGRVTLQAEEFTPGGWSGWLDLTAKHGPAQGKLQVSVEIFIPVPPKPKDPAEHITDEVRKPVPFLLRCLDTGRVHRLSTYTVVGRSHRQLDPRYDLVLQSPGIIDVSRRHAIIKCWCGADPSSWRVRVYPTEDEEIEGQGVGWGSGAGHAGGGTSVDNEPIELWCGTEIIPGSVLRFGIREMWVLEKAVIFQKSQVGEVAVQRAHRNAKEDPGTYRELKVPSTACDHALQHCKDWDSFVRVVLEWCGEPDEVPCVDVIEVLDECGARAGRYEANSLEAQEAFNIRGILKEVRMGTTVRLRLSADPQLLAPILRRS